MTDRPGVRHTYQDALGERDFQLLLEGATLLDEQFRLETRFILLLGGRLGMRAGEICHLQEDWIDWDREMINIPHFENCDCGYCREQAKQEAEWNDTSVEAAMKGRWKPKTDRASCGGGSPKPMDYSGFGT